MKKYHNPEIEIVEVMASDIITFSPGTETPTMDETDGNWQMGVTINP